MKQPEFRSNIERRLINPFELIDADPEILVNATGDYARNHLLNQRCQFLAGNLYLHAANNVTDPNEALEVVERAVGCWDSSVWLSKQKDEAMSTVGLQARLQLAYAPVYRWRAVSLDLPPYEVQQETYRYLLGVAFDQLDNIQDIRSKDGPQTERLSKPAGNMALLEVLALGMRFGLQELGGDGTWLATPTFPTQSTYSKRFAKQPRSSGVLIYTQPDRTEAPELTYKVAISSATNTPVEIATDAVHVNVRNDLKVTKRCAGDSARPNYQLPIGTIAKECIDESYGFLSDSELDRLNERQSLLLDKLDECVATTAQSI